MKTPIAFALVAGLAAIAAAWAYFAFLAVPADGPERIALGRSLYDIHCASCHGRDLEGEPNWRSRRPDGTVPAPPHDASGHTWHHPDQILFDYVKKGGQALAPKDFQSRMPAYDAALSDAEIRAILAYIKSRWPADIRARQETLNRG